MKKTSKISYVDNLKVLLTALVILHHVAVTYSTPGAWYYKEPTATALIDLVLTAIVSINQSFFMGFFFFLSAYFVPASYNKKGFATFLTDRLIRLGIPLLFYAAVLSPLLSYLPYRYAGRHAITYRQYLGGFDSWIDFGVLWFVAALLLFNIIYALYRKAGRPVPSFVKVPGTRLLLLTALILGGITFLVRLLFPVGWVLKPVGFQLGHFPQYLTLFIAGIVAAEHNWLNADIRLPGAHAIKPALLLIVAVLPLLLILPQLWQFPVSLYAGGAHWQSLLYACWEQLLGFCLIAVMLFAGKYKWNRQPAWLPPLARSTFAVYIFHPLFVVLLSVALLDWAVDPGVKFLVVTPVSIITTFCVGMILVKIPLLNRVV